ncbi:hypothetical protein NEHOM01_1844 [Nematocida homosporus]|uniref:uncharacterized protein n=1 Tax=Nematocida homosporus TaxID=1912981 RepID=UPI00221EB2BF|nr:uncharacterized protein NEHOM01_1844 [Nematocida homosporus]KAI5186986.1 hypothetical protein NEHOM01_1844 [Nematocida homosporus]
MTNSPNIEQADSDEQYEEIPFNIPKPEGDFADWAIKYVPMTAAVDERSIRYFGRRQLARANWEEENARHASGGDILAVLKRLCVNFPLALIFTVLFSVFLSYVQTFSIASEGYGVVIAEYLILSGLIINCFMFSIKRKTLLPKIITRALSLEILICCLISASVGVDIAHNYSLLTLFSLVVGGNFLIFCSVWAIKSAQGLVGSGSSRFQLLQRYFLRRNAVFVLSFMLVVNMILSYFVHQHLSPAHFFYLWLLSMILVVYMAYLFVYDYSCMIVMEKKRMRIFLLHCFCIGVCITLTFLTYWIEPKDTTWIQDRIITASFVLATLVSIIGLIIKTNQKEIAETYQKKKMEYVENLADNLSGTIFKIAIGLIVLGTIIIIGFEIYHAIQNKQFPLAGFFST